MDDDTTDSTTLLKEMVAMDNYDDAEFHNKTRFIIQ